MKKIFLFIGCAILVSLLTWRIYKQPMRQTSLPKLPAAEANATTVAKLASAVPVAPSKAKPRSPAQQARLAEVSKAPGARSGKPWQDIPEWQTLPPRERLIRLLRAPFGIEDRGKVRVLELAKDELYVRDNPNPHARVRSIALQSDAADVLRLAEDMALTLKHAPQLVLYPPGTTKRTDANRWIVSDQVLIETTNAPQVIASAQAAGLNDAQAMAAAPGFVLGKDTRFPGAAIIAAADLNAVPGVTTARPMLAFQQSRRFVPTDPLFSKQWHLKNSGSIHINVSGVWDTNKGSGVKVGVIDDGLQISHPDLMANVDATVPTLNYDYNDNDDDPSPNAPLDDPLTTDVNEAENGDCHGTAVAGLIAATADNGVGGCGVAPEAKLVGLRLIAGPSTPADEASAFGHRNDVIQIKSNSWGPSDSEPWVLGTADPVVTSAFTNVTNTGRGGLGTIVTFAAGNGRDNGDQSNKDAYANNMHNIAVAALTSSGAPAFYSEYGTNVLVSAPADGVTTTDLVGNAGYNPTQDGTPITQRDYTDEFNGTSAATPIVSGVIALMLHANPNLGWRDVKEILLRSSKKVGATDSEWVSRAGGLPALAPIKHNPKYGGGMVDAAAATTMAATWTNLGTTSTLTKTVSADTAIPDNNATGITKNFDFSGDTATRVEMVEVTVDISHEYRGDLTIQLVSPSGTISNLATKSIEDDGAEDASPSDTPLPVDQRGFHGWTFTSARHWGEASVGTWKLVVRDGASGDIGTFHNATIKLYGVSAAPVAITSVSAGLIARVGETPAFSITSTGYPVITQQWFKGTTTITNATAATYTLPAVSLTSAADYKVVVTNVTGTDTRTISLGVVQPLPATQTVNVGTTLTLQAPAAGPSGQTITYQWSKDGTPLANDPPGINARISGVNTSKLVVLKTVEADHGNYECAVTVGSLTGSSGVCAVSIRLKPDIQTASFPSDLIVSRAVNIPLTIANGVTKVSISGLPTGLTYSTLTGTITGIPNTAVTNAQIKITATNLAGSTTTLVPISLNIAKLDDNVVGTFNGLIDRNPSTLSNSNYGGALKSLVVQSNGSFSGSIVQAGLSSIAFSGRLVASTSADPTATVSVKRPSPLLPLSLSFTIDRSNGHLINSTLADSSPNTWTANVDGWRNAYSSAHPATAVKGLHNFWCDSPANDGAPAPQGSCVGAVTISSTGDASLSLHLADGVVVTSSTTIGSTGFVPVHNMLYSNKGSVHGWLQITDQLSPTLNTVGGTLTWNKTGAASSSDRTYKTGFDFGVSNANSLTAVGNEYVKPSSPTILWGLTDVLVGQVNAKLVFTGTAIEGNPSALPVVPPAAMLADLNKSFRVAYLQTLTLPSPNAATLVVKLDATNGIFNGTALLKDNTPVVQRTLTYYGVIANGQTRGKGWFTVVRVPQAGETLSNAPIQSGAVKLLDAP